LSDEASAVMTEEKEFSAMTMEDFLRADEDAFGTPKHGDIVDGVVVRVDADEVLVDIGAKAEGIISGKELGFRGDPDLDLSPGDVIKVIKVLEVNRKRNRLIVSQKAAEDEDRARRREDLFSRIQVGDVVTGAVSGLTSYGAFVDIGGADGLIHISELSWDRVSRVTDVLQLGEQVEVKVIKLDPDQNRISLSLRQLQQDPWERFVQTVPVGSIVSGTVTKTKKYGAFLQVMPGIEGLLHISELSWDHVDKTEDVLKVGEDVQVKVIGVDTARRRVSLSLKQLSGSR
jgi:small subunit ribosomal protein S1